MTGYIYNKKRVSRAEISPTPCKHCVYHNSPICNHQRLIQLYDRNLINELTDSQRFLTLSNSNQNPSISTYTGEVNNNFSTGGYTLSTTNVKNDTLNLPGPGIYSIQFSFKSTFPLSNPIVIIRNPVPFTYSVLTNGNVDGEVAVQGYPVPSTEIASGLINFSILYKISTLTPYFRIYLKDFKFNASLNNTVTVSNLILTVQKLQDL